MGVPTETSGVHDLAFWGILAPVVIFGSWQLWRARQWDRLALVASVVATLAGLYRLGPWMLHPEVVRYGVFLVAPSVVAFACLVRGLLIVPTSCSRIAVR